ncbi:hypothetical protein KAR91_40550 [Candidatus Pacearchaeota archaeon]|nr:hypothetical protein [Candidatus Pacearchaeota archaeon]
MAEFIANKAFAEYFNSVVEEVPYERPYSARPNRTRTKITGFMGKVWRWFYYQMMATSREFGTITHKNIACEVESKCWIITITYPRPGCIPKEHLFYETARGMNDAIPQLSHQTQIRTDLDARRPIIKQFPISERFGSFDDRRSVPPVVSVTPTHRKIEWKQFAYAMGVPVGWHNDKICYWSVAYDRLEDCLYVHYHGN